MSGSPEDRTQRDPRIRRIWATSPRLPCGSNSSRTPRSRTAVAERPTNERSLLLPKQACFHLHLYPMCVANSVGAYLPCQWAGRRSNPRLRFFRPPHDQRCASVPASQLPAHVGLLGLSRSGHEKRLDACVTPSLHVESSSLEASVT